jgi:hypothetical protein
MAKMARERALREKRARKQEKKEEKKQAAAAALAAEAAGIPLEADEDAEAAEIAKAEDETVSGQELEADRGPAADSAL